jgi:hypothetical protein
MASRRVWWLCLVASLVLAGCGGSGDGTSSGATNAPATTASGAQTSDIASRALANNEMRGFTGGKPVVDHTVARYLADVGAPPDQVASEKKRLAGLGFLAGVHKDLTSDSGKEGVSIVEQFKTPAGARSELANEEKFFKAQDPGNKVARISAVPGAVDLVTPDARAVNVAFTDGDYYYLVGAFVPTVNARTHAAIVAAAKHLYQRVHG